MAENHVPDGPFRLRTGHVAGIIAVLSSLGVFAISGDLPVGRFSMPGAGMMPRVAAILVLVFGVILIATGRNSTPMQNVRWEDLSHAGCVLAASIAATLAYEVLGFLIAMTSLLLGLTVAIERQPLLPAILFSTTLTVATYVVFNYGLKVPLAKGILGFVS